MSENIAVATAVDEARRHEQVVIIVNTRAREWSHERISFEQVIELAYPGSATDQYSFTVSYTRGHHTQRSGSLSAGHHVKVHEGMVFDAYRTLRS